MTYKTILFERDPTDAFATVTLNRPDKLNAMNGDLIEELDDAVMRAAGDRQVNALILTGAGRAFTTGYDLNSDDFELDAEGWRDNIAGNCEKLMNIWKAPIPIVAIATAAVTRAATAAGISSSTSIAAPASSSALASATSRSASLSLRP